MIKKINSPAGEGGFNLPSLEGHYERYIELSLFTLGKSAGEYIVITMEAYHG